MLRGNVYKIQNSYVCIQKLAKTNFCTERNLKSMNEKFITSNIKNFFQDKNVLVTGATGFMGKCLVEKLLRSCPGIKNIYVLVRPKTGADCEKRIAELTNSQVFDRLKQEHPKAINKLVGLNGNIESPDLGLSASDYNKLIENEPVVFHSAANISLQTFDIHNFRKITRTNLGGTKNVLDLCHKIPNCKNLVYLSSVVTSYDLNFEVKDRIYPTKHLPEHVLSVLENDNELAAIIDKVKNEFSSAYSYAKRLAENLILNGSKGLTVAIVRPSGVGAAWREPVKGWIDNATSVNALALLMGKGVLRIWRCDPEEPFDIVPVDTANNCVISSAWYTSEFKPNTVSVISYNTSSINRLKRREFIEMMLEASKKNPFNEIFIYPNVKITNSRIQFHVWAIFVHFLPAFIADILLRLSGKKPLIMKVQKTIQMLYGSMPTPKFHYDNSKVFEMWETLSEEDKKEFWFDLRQIHWPTYIEDIMLGLKQYYLKEDLSELPDARKNLERKYKKYKLMQMTALTTALCSSVGVMYFFI